MSNHENLIGQTATRTYTVPSPNPIWDKLARRLRDHYLDVFDEHVEEEFLQGAWEDVHEGFVNAFQRTPDPESRDDYDYLHTELAVYLSIGV